MLSFCTIENSGETIVSQVHLSKAESIQDSHNAKTSSGSPHFVDTRASAIGQQAMQLMMQNQPQTNTQLSMQNYIHSSSAVQKKSIQRVESEEISTEVETTQFSEHASNAPASVDTPSEKPNNTGLPDNLKSGIESLSGMSMDHVKVHFNSDRPAQLNAHAYAQGSEIHVAPGQEQHLPHEAWHVVQQAQGRVKPTMQMKGDAPANDNASLESEADAMGKIASQHLTTQLAKQLDPGSLKSSSLLTGALQRKVKVVDYDADRPVTILSALKNDAGIATTYTGSNAKVNHGYERTKKISAVIDKDKTTTDSIGGVPADYTTTAQIGSLGAVESMVYGYKNKHDYHGGHLVGDRFWKNSATSLLEGNLVPMLQNLNSSLYKIFEHEIATYLDTNPGSKVEVEITLSYDGTKSIQLDNPNSQITNLLNANYADPSSFDLTQSVSTEPRVPYQVSIKLYTYTNSPDLAQKKFENPPGDILKSYAYGTKGYFDHVSWDATSSEKAAKYKKVGHYTRFRPVTLKSTGVRTYNFYQQTD